MSRSPFYWLRRITSKCFFIGHEDPIKMLTRSGLHFECPRCGEDFGEVLKGQTFKARVVPGQRDVLTLRFRDRDARA